MKSMSKRACEYRAFAPAACITIGLSVVASGAPGPQLTLEIRDYAAAPMTGKIDGAGQTDGMLARITSLREEPGGAGRLFLNDLNGPLYILDNGTKKFTT